ncbi:hypothetical protein [Pseudoalteromonas nigrifaciens]|uniref:hypothetical protein n=1 Tax=Pseudoalteromonas nigrifaciens TaxID=28109 RepID=UPI003D0511F9
MSEICFLNQFDDSLDLFPELVSLVRYAKKDNFKASEYDMSQFYEENFIQKLIAYIHTTEQKRSMLISAHNTKRFEWPLFRNENFSISLQYSQKGVLPASPINTCIANDLKYLIVKGKVNFDTYMNNISNNNIYDSYLEKTNSETLSAGEQIEQSSIVECVIPTEFEEDTYMLMISGSKKSDTCWNFNSKSLKFENLTSTDVDYSRVEYCLSIFEEFDCTESLEALKGISIHHPAYYVRWAAVTTAINISKDSNWDMQLLQKVMKQDAKEEVRDCAKESLKMMFPNVEVG